MLSRALRNRFIELHFDTIPRNELEIILEKKCLLPSSRAQRLVEVMHRLQVSCFTFICILELFIYFHTTVSNAYIHWVYRFTDEVTRLSTIELHIQVSLLLLLFK